MAIQLCTTNHASVLISICLEIQKEETVRIAIRITTICRYIFFPDNLTDSMHNYTNLKIFLWSGSGDGPDEPTKQSTAAVAAATTTTVVPFYSVNSVGSPST